MVEEHSCSQPVTNNIKRSWVKIEVCNVFVHYTSVTYRYAHLTPQFFPSFLSINAIHWSTIRILLNFSFLISWVKRWQWSSDINQLWVLHAWFTKFDLGPPSITSGHWCSVLHTSRTDLAIHKGSQHSHDKCILTLDTQRWNIKHCDLCCCDKWLWIRAIAKKTAEAEMMIRD